MNTKQQTSNQPSDPELIKILHRHVDPTFALILQNFYKDINREGMYIRYLWADFGIKYI